MGLPGISQVQESNCSFLDEVRCWGGAGVPRALPFFIGVISLPREARLLSRRCSFGHLIHYCTCATMPFIIPYFDLQCSQSEALGAGGCSGCSCRRCSLERGTLRVLEQPGSAAVPGHEQVPQPPEEQLLARDAQCSASLWGAGTTPLGGKASKSLSKPSLFPPLILLNYF